MFLKYFGIHVFNVVGVLLVILVGGYYLGLIERSGPFPGFAGEWICGSHELDLVVDEKLNVFIKPELKKTSLHLQQYSESSAHFVDEGHSVLFAKLPLKFRGYRLGAYIETADEKSTIYLCRRPKIFESYFYSH